jgi:hypothetical protein
MGMSRTRKKRATSESSQKLTSPTINAASALPPKADVSLTCRRRSGLFGLNSNFFPYEPGPPVRILFALEN